MEKYGFVYIWYDRKHKRYYIGCRWGHEDDGYVCSSKWMKMSYGNRPNDFKRRVLKTAIESRKELYEEEQRWLNFIKPTEIKPINPYPRYYNLNIKNNTMWHSYDEHIKTVGQRISASKKGKKLGPYSEKHKKAISEAKKGWNPSKETRERMRQAKLGKKHSEEWKIRNSEYLKEQWASGKRKSKKRKSSETPKI